MEPAVDVSTLPQQAQRLLDPTTPVALRTLGARGIAPGLKPGEALTVVCLLAEGEDVLIANMAKATLKALPVPVLNGALVAELPPGVLDVVAPQFAGELSVMERILAHPNLLPSTVTKVAAACSEAVSELIATNEERLLKHPEIIEKLYMNRATRMSTTDRLIELAVRNGLELNGIPAFREAAAAIANELIAEPSEEPSPGDVAFQAAVLAVEPVDPTEEVHEMDAEGKEVVKPKHKAKAKRMQDMTISEKIRLTVLGSATERAILVRDSNRLVATAAAKSPAMGEQEAERIAKSRAVSDEVLKIIGESFPKHYPIKYALTENPRTPFQIAAKLIVHLRESELKALAKSKNVSSAVSTAAKQHLSRREKRS
jgi:hypothetical protein